MFMLRNILEVTRSSTISDHPIDTLIRGAKQEHDLRLKEASAVRSLNGAVNEYRRRYDRHPPPGFDVWYDFATARSSVVISDYDSIHNDLLPFWSLPPAELRRRTWELVSDPSNDIAAIRIRNGSAWPSENISHPYYPMLRDVADMVNGFSSLLPDMDLAINLNNDCRVAVPWSEVEKMREFGRNAGTLEWGKDVHWSVDRAGGWETAAAESVQGAIFDRPSLKETFLSYGTVGCSPGSRALTNRVWDKHKLCLSCIQPHSLGGFMHNWTLAADVCHQPDLANLHGQYMLPWRFKGTHRLMPVFSQRKLHGFNDILYPGGWLYDGAEEYAPTYSPSTEHPDPPFREKANSLFWRGQAVEGISVSGNWKGMTPQRFAYLANDGKSIDDYAIVLADTPDGKYTYRQLAHANLHSSLSLDVAFDRSFALCVGPDCVDQKKSFNISSKRIPFQQHWQSRYLLDIDDGLFGHFLPFLKSGSLPFRMGIFREWYDSRISPWLHFVPLDSRLHALHSTLAYFQGIDTTDMNGRPVRLAAHEREAESIAEAGREWADEVTREEDKLIYFFRLCLEWGRLTDDRRDEIGFQM
ncbi:hypothetical protein FGG08_001654 [Glutinoglossum americanum]|uniref:Glycosyl transferase CAP10 domain-containing protein n=1 Tax=Glutinoglossum americanum TaxID=1670608 RepID=A0A9P8I6J6_9PEZI|nr:hypothetical protein FGG08_001654 [Glutinoglossum americanum]